MKRILMVRIILLMSLDVRGSSTFMPICARWFVPKFIYNKPP